MHEEYYKIRRRLVETGFRNLCSDVQYETESVRTCCRTARLLEEYTFDELYLNIDACIRSNGRTNVSFLFDNYL